MSTLTVCTLRPYNCAVLEVVWVSGTNQYEVRDETGRIGKPRSDVAAAMRAAAKIATDRYANRMNRPL